MSNTKIEKYKDREIQRQRNTKIEDTKIEIYRNTEKDRDLFRKSRKNKFYK